MTGFIFLAALVGLLVVLGFLEYAAHRRNLAAVPIRVHVNGTRGKSSVTRLATWALNEGGIRTFGKTTGTLPRMIFPDGHEYPVYRPGGHANVLEQLRILSVARAHRAQAVVVECMALQPRLQWLSERKLVRATHGVVTNAREDHLDVMGPGELDVALALASMTPVGKKMLTTETRNLEIFRGAARDRGTKLVEVPRADVAAVSAEEMDGFSYDEHPDNVALVLALCRELGVDRETALRGMCKASPDEGAMRSYEVDFFGRRLCFINGFAANDPESTATIWKLALKKHPEVEKRIAVFNCRGDRQQRSQQLAEAYATWPQGDGVLLMGSGTFVFARGATKRGCDPTRFAYAEGAGAGAVFELIVSMAGRSSVVVGMGNIAGPGLELTHYFRNRASLAAQEVA